MKEKGDERDERERSGQGDVRIVCSLRKAQACQKRGWAHSERCGRFV